MLIYFDNTILPAIMKLMTQTLKRDFARVGDQSDAPDPVVIARF